MKTKVIDELPAAENFKTDESVREAVQIVFKDLLKDWKGTNTNCLWEALNDKVNEVAKREKDKGFKWFVETVLP